MMSVLQDFCTVLGIAAIIVVIAMVLLILLGPDPWRRK